MALRDEPADDDEWYQIWRAHPVAEPGFNQDKSGRVYKAHGFKPNRAAKRAGQRGIVVIVDRNVPDEQRQHVRGEGAGSRNIELVRAWKERERAELEDQALTERAALARGRRRRLQMQTERPGQAAFRDDLITAYGQCVITGVSTREALEAAHIEPHDGEVTDVVTNGLLLRVDLHKLFDRLLLWIDADLKVRIAASVTDPEYRRLEGLPLRPPVDPADGPDAVALRVHERACTG